MVGVNLINGGERKNALYCVEEKGDQRILYFPDDIKGYGFKNGRVYISKYVETSDVSRLVFLERLREGPTALYYYRGDKFKTFFLETKDSILIELSKEGDGPKNYKAQLSDYMNDCAEVVRSSRDVRYTRQSLSKFVRSYNNCEPGPFPRFRFGFNAGYVLTKLMPATDDIRSDMQGLDFVYKGGYAFGVFLDEPISMSAFSLNVEINFARWEYIHGQPVDDHYKELVAKISALQLPVHIKYALPVNNVRPYIFAGGIYTHNIENNHALFDIYESGTLVEIFRGTDQPFIDDQFIGYSIGAGLEFVLNSNLSSFVETRFSQQYGLSGDNALDINQLRFITGIYF